MALTSSGHILFINIVNKYKNRWCKSLLLSDGPFDIQGGGAGIFPRDKLFFSLFLHNKLFFSKVNCNKFFIFWKNNTSKSEKCKRKQHTE